MKKKPVFILMLGVLLMLSLVFVGCPDDSNNDDNDNENDTAVPVAKKIEITGITEMIKLGYDRAQIFFYSDFEGGSSVVSGANISDNSVIFNLKKYTNGVSTDFTGSGSFYVQLTFTKSSQEGIDYSERDHSEYVYTGSQASVDFSSEEKLMQNAGKVNITQATTTIPFNRFQVVPEWWD